MDLPPTAASASAPSAAHYLPSSTSTAAGHNSSVAGLVGQTGPRTQPTVQSSASALGSAPPAFEKCEHKDVTRCSLHRRECCSCGDSRPHEQYYERYINGGTVPDPPRWAHYCSYCKDYWDRLNARVPPFRENQPRLTAWDLFHLVTPPNFAASSSSSSSPSPSQNLTHSESSRHSLNTSSAQSAFMPPDDGFPTSYASFQLLSPNFVYEYHPVVVEHIRTWGQLERRISDAPRYSPEFESLLSQYYTARYKAKRMTELDRQSRGGSLSSQARDEYFQLLNTPGPFSMPISSHSDSSSGNSANSRGSSGGEISAGHLHPNLGHIGISFGRVASFGSFLQSTSNAQPSGMSGNIHGRGSSTISHQTPTEENRPTLGGVSLVTNPTANSPAQASPHRSNRRRGSIPSDNMSAGRINAQTENIGRLAPVIDRERERDRDRETSRITAGTSHNAAGATASEGWPPLSTTTAAPTYHSIPLPLHPAPSTEIPETSHYRSHSRIHSLDPSVTSFIRSRVRPISSVTPDIETDRTAADRRRQLRERNESEWESQRPMSSNASNNVTTNRISVDSTVVDAMMSDPPSSQNSDASNRSSNSAHEPARTVESEQPGHNSLRHRPYFSAQPTSEPWNTSLFPAESSRNQSTDQSAMASSRRDPSTHFSTNNPQNTMSGSPITSIAPFVFPTNRRTLRPTLLDQNTNSPTRSPPESSTARNGLTSPAHRLSANFLPSLPHLPAPRFSPPRTLTRPRGGSITNNTANHHRQNSNGSDGLSARRRERMNPLTQSLGTRTDAEREDYESPIRTMFTQNYEEYQRAEEQRRRYRELEAEQRGPPGSPPMSGNGGASMRRLQEHRNQRNYELLQRSNLQRQMQQTQSEIANISRSNPPPPQGWYTNWPTPSQMPSSGPATNTRSPDHTPALPFGITAEDDVSSTSEGDYEDLIPLDNSLGEDEQLLATFVDGYFPRISPESAHRRRARLRGQFGVPGETDAGNLAGSSQSSGRATENDLRERLPTRLERRRLRERDAETRLRQDEALRDIASLMTGARDSGVMGFPHRWNRGDSLGVNSGSRNTNNSSQTSRTLDHPERPDNMKEEDLKIMVDCKVCYGQIADMVLLPCAHLVLCQWCADTVAPAAPNRPEGIVAPRSNCPVCRARVERKIKVFRC